MKKVRAHVIVKGRVQGVFFRYHTQKEALKHNLSGWVRNTFDGKVEAILEGTQENVKAVIDWCHTGPPSAWVENVEVEWENYTGEFLDFSITY